MKENIAHCNSCLNENCLIKKHIHLDAMKQYVQKKHSFICKKGQQFIIEGSPIQGLYFIFDGKVKAQLKLEFQHDLYLPTIRSW